MTEVTKQEKIFFLLLGICFMLYYVNNMPSQVEVNLNDSVAAFLWPVVTGWYLICFISGLFWICVVATLIIQAYRRFLLCCFDGASSKDAKELSDPLV